MVPSATAFAAAVAALTVHTNAAGLYPKSSKVLQVTTADYDRLIAKSNYTSIVEYASSLAWLMPSRS